MEGSRFLDFRCLTKVSSGGKESRRVLFESKLTFTSAFPLPWPNMCFSNFELN